jgi:hypothetical protein
MDWYLYVVDLLFYEDKPKKSSYLKTTRYVWSDMDLNDLFDALDTDRGRSMLDVPTELKCIIGCRYGSFYEAVALGLSDVYSYRPWDPEVESITEETVELTRRTFG